MPPLPTLLPPSPRSTASSRSPPPAHLLLLLLLLLSYSSPSSGFLQDSALRALLLPFTPLRGNLLFQDCESPGVFAGLPAYGTINIKVSLSFCSQAVRPSTSTTTRRRGRGHGRDMEATRDGAPVSSLFLENQRGASSRHLSRYYDPRN